MITMSDITVQDLCGFKLIDVFDTCMALLEGIWNRNKYNIVAEDGNEYLIEDKLKSQLD